MTSIFRSWLWRTWNAHWKNGFWGQSSLAHLCLQSIFRNAVRSKERRKVVSKSCFIYMPSLPWVKLGRIFFYRLFMALPSPGARKTLQLFHTVSSLERPGDREVIGFGFDIKEETYFWASVFGCDLVENPEWALGFWSSGWGRSEGLQGHSWKWLIPLQPPK